MGCSEQIYLKKETENRNIPRGWLIIQSGELKPDDVVKLYHVFNLHKDE